MLSKLGFTNDQTPNLNDVLQNFNINEETLGEITSAFTENEDIKKLINTMSDKQQLKKLVNEKTSLDQTKVDEFVEKIQDNQASVLANNLEKAGDEALGIGRNIFSNFQDK